MNLSRLLQPRNPLFWLMVVLNGLSSVFTWYLHVHDLPLASRLLLGCFALGNAFMGIRIALRLMRQESENGGHARIRADRLDAGHE